MRAVTATAITAQLLLLECVSALSSPPLDLFAYPAYAVQLRPDKPISRSVADGMLSGGTAAEQQQQQEKRQHEVLLQTQSQSATSTAASSSSNGSSPGKPYLMRSAVNGQAYLCQVPQQQQQQQQPGPSAESGVEVKQALSAEEKAERRRRSEQEKREAYERGLASLEPLKGTCLYFTQGWFTYAFCHGSEIRQFHAIRVPSPNGLGYAEDPTQDSYTLGTFSSRIVEDEGLVNTRKGRALGTLREILESEDKDSSAIDVVGGPRSATKSDHWDGHEEEELYGQKSYLVQLWTGGTVCDKTGVERRIEVQFHCNTQSTDRIFLIRETAICEYVMVIHTPRLCGERIFAGDSSDYGAAGARKKGEELVIECRPVVSDDLLLDQTSRQQQTSPNTGGEARTASSQENSLLPVPQQHGEADGERGASREQPAGEGQTQQESPSADEHDAHGDEYETEIVMDGWILAVDPATGELVLESEIDGGSVNGLLDNGALGEGNMEDLMKMLQKSIETALERVQGDAAAKEDVPPEQPQPQGQAQGEPSPEQQQRPGVQQPQNGQAQQPIQRAGHRNHPPHHHHHQHQHQHRQQQAGQGPMSRLDRAGAHNHKAIAEKFLQGKLQQPVKQQQQQQQAPLQADRQLGTPQHINLKKAFEQSWPAGSRSADETPEEKRRKDEL